ncbi:MAG: copper chaperone PCu(A)C [Acidimicrobiia bacterium]|nr:copper chaperone PCu(A)C [Acidimicrobiia bacterium]
MRRAGVPAVLIALAAVAAGCGGDDGLQVEGVWARTSPAMADAGAVYLRITSPEADRLIGAAVDPSVAAMSQIHETVMVSGEGEGEGMGAMTMQEVGAIDLPAGETVALAPGGYHIMLMRLASPLEAGQTFEITLTFETAGAQTYQVEVRDDAP